MLTAAALLLVGLWLALLVRASRARATGAPGRARRLDAALLLATLATSLATCAAPVVPLVSAFPAVAEAPPARKADVLRRAIEEDRSRMPLALVSVAVLVAGLSAVASGRRRREALRPRGASAGPGER